MKISVVGTGYVGLISGACLAEKGHRVTCIDILEEKVEAINRAKPPIYEVGLQELLDDVVTEKKLLSATTDLKAAVLDSELTLIAVGTPFDGQRIDLSYIREAARQIGDALREKDSFHAVVVKSTVVPGTTEEVVAPIVAEASGKILGQDFGVGMNPEFLREGDAISDFRNPDRIVLGGTNEQTLERMGHMYKEFESTDKILTSPKTAEMIKYTANSLLALLISFSNEMGNLCSTVGNVDIRDVLHGVSLDKRFSPILEGMKRVTPSMVTYLEAGCGFGGSCFPKDVKALIEYGREKGSPTKILESAIALNAEQPNRLIELLSKHYPKLDDVRVAVLGLAFKPGTDDIRESPALTIIEKLIELGARVSAFDPIAMPNTQRQIPTSHSLSYSDSVDACIEEVDAIILVTSWPEFNNIAELINKSPNPPLLVDGRRIIDKDSVPRYEGIGLTLKTAQLV